MKYTETQPSLRLSKYISCYWTLSGEAVDCHPEGIAPDGSVEMIFHLADPFIRFHDPGGAKLQPASVIVGQMRRPVVVQPTGRVDILGVRFQPQGSSRFIHQPIDELTDKILECGDVWGSSIRQLEEKLREADSGQRIAILETFLLGIVERRGSPSNTYQRVEAAVRLVQSANGLQPVERIAQTLGVSSRQLERQFKSIVGLSPKSLQRIVRFQRALQLIRNGGVQGILIAHECGYYDQAHFIHDFKCFTGHSPSIYNAETYQMAQHFIS
jgi:AraC-like DNA-binding protein